MGGQQGAVARPRLSLPGELSYRSTSLRPGHPNYFACAVMYLGPVRKVRGDEELEANCSPSLASNSSSPLTL